MSRRLVLAGMRSCVLALVLAVLCGPTIVLQRDKTEPSYVALLIDTSQSMGLQDTYSDEKLARAVAVGAGIDDPTGLAAYSRLALLRSALTRDDAAALRELGQHNAIQLCTFARGMEVQGYVRTGDDPAALVDYLASARPDGSATDLAGAIKNVITASQGRRLAAIVVASDCRTTQPTSLKDVFDLAQARQIPLLPLRIGSPIRPLDVEVGPVRAEPSVFANDVMAVEVQVATTGLTEPTDVNVSLIDERDGVVVARRLLTMTPREPTATFELHVRPRRTGRTQYRVVADPLDGERITGNNTDRIDVSVLDDKLRVLYVEGYPRYEYRYVKNALLREATAELSVLLLEADERFVQEGTQPIRRFPQTPEELNRFDVVLFGDVDPRGGWLTDSQMDMLLDFVAHRGGGFGLLAGEASAPHRYAGTPLEKLVPVRIDPTFLGHYDAPLVSGFRMQLTPEGRRLGLFRFPDGAKTTFPDPALSELDYDEDIAGSLPELFWCARTLGPQPGASVLASHPTARVLGSETGVDDSEPLPLMVLGRYGAGRILFLATDDTWRWRRFRVNGGAAGEFVYDAFWVQATRMLRQPDPGSGNRRLVLRTDRRTYEYGVTVQAEVEVYDSDWLAEQKDTLSIVAGRYEGPGTDKGSPSSNETHSAGGSRDAGSSSTDSRVDPRRGRLFPVDRFEIHRLSPTSNVFEGSFVPPGEGRYVLEVEGMAVISVASAASVSIRIRRPDLEIRRPEADHAVCERMAAATGGRVIDLDQLETEFGAIRDRSRIIPDDLIEPIWDSKLILALFVGMISMEWVMRKTFGLL